MKVLGWILAIVAAAAAAVGATMYWTARKAKAAVTGGLRDNPPNDPTGTLGVGAPGGAPKGDATAPAVKLGFLPNIKLPGGKLPNAASAAPADATPQQHQSQTATQTAIEALLKMAGVSQ